MTIQQPLILVVDDNRTMRLMLCKVLEEAGFTPAEAESGTQTLQIVPRLHPDAILLDVEMPGMDGFSTCQELRKLPHCQHIPIMMVTSHDDPTSINKAYESGATDFTAKPINWDILVHRVRYLMRTGQNFLELNRTQNELSKAREKVEKINLELEQRVDVYSDQLTKTKQELQLTTDAFNATRIQLIEVSKIAIIGELFESAAQKLAIPIQSSIEGILSLEKKFDEMLGSQANKLTENALKESNAIIHSVLNHLDQASMLINSLKQLSIDKVAESDKSFLFNEYLEKLRFDLLAVHKPQLSFEINCPKNLVVNTYPDTLSRIILTLVGNSILHGYKPSESGIITLKVSNQNDMVFLSYSDTGKGIPERIVNKFFNPFVTTKSRAGNAGLGLYIVNNQIKKILGGSIRCESKPGQGATFIIAFPQLNKSQTTTLESETA